MGIGYEHGITSEQIETSVSTPRTAGSGIVFVVGTAPAHTVGGTVNAPIMALNYKKPLPRWDIAKTGKITRFAKSCIPVSSFTGFRRFSL